jgi:hypothetical protein
VRPLWLECEVLTGSESVSAGRFVRRDGRRRSCGGPGLTPAARTVIPTAPCSYPYSYGDQFGSHGELCAVDARQLLFQSLVLLLKPRCGNKRGYPRTRMSLQSSSYKLLLDLYSCIVPLQGNLSEPEADICQVQYSPLQVSSSVFFSSHIQRTLVPIL